MKTSRKLVWLVSSLVGLVTVALAQPADVPEKTEAADTTRATAPADRGEPQDNSARTPDGAAAPEGEKGLRLNFRGVPLEMVLNYLSDAAGFIIVPETDVKGKVDVWSNQPLTKEEAVDVLNSVLIKNGYVAIRNGRTLTIVSREEAKKRNIPVIPGNDPDQIPKTDDVVTQIIPVRYINAVQLTRDLQPLLPEKAQLTANEGGNALVLTDTQANIRRMAEIVQALDTSVASISTVRVFPLRYADAKELATIVTQVFQTTDNSRNSDLRARVQNFFRGGGFGGGGPGGAGGGDNNAGSNAGRPGAARVTAVADERSNSLVVGAPDELIPTIEELVKSVDTDVEDVTELRVFRLKYSDPTEMADLLTQLFPDDSRTSNNNTRGGGIQFGGPGGPFGNRRNNNADDSSARAKKQARVIAVPDPRTGSVVVTAARDLMNQIGQMIEQLDADPAKRQKVFVYSLENADAQNVEEILRGLFENQNNVNNRTRTGQQNNNALNNRANSQQNQGVNNNPGSGFGQGGNLGNPR